MSGPPEQRQHPFRGAFFFQSPDEQEVFARALKAYFSIRPNDWPEIEIPQALIRKEYYFLFDRLQKKIQTTGENIDSNVVIKVFHEIENDKKLIAGIIRDAYSISNQERHSYRFNYTEIQESRQIVQTYMARSRAQENLFADLKNIELRLQESESQYDLRGAALTSILIASAFENNEVRELAEVVESPLDKWLKRIGRSIRHLLSMSSRFLPIAVGFSFIVAMAGGIIIPNIIGPGWLVVSIVMCIIVGYSAGSGKQQHD